MTFEEFQATGRDIEDLRLTRYGEIWDDEMATGAIPGRMYLDSSPVPVSGVCIEKYDEEQWYLIIENMEYTGSLEEMEKILYKWSEEMIS